MVLSFYQLAQVLHFHTWWWSLAASCACGVFPSAIGANTPCTGGGDTHCNLRWWTFSFRPLAHILHLRSSNLHCVVVVCGGGLIYSRIIITIYSKEVLACTNTIRFSQLLVYYVYIVKQLICLLISDCAAKCEYTRSYTFLHMHTCRMQLVYYTKMYNKYMYVDILKINRKC